MFCCRVILLLYWTRGWERFSLASTAMGKIYYDYYSLGVAVNLICQFDWLRDGHRPGTTLFLGVSVRAFEEEKSI